MIFDKLLYTDGRGMQRVKFPGGWRRYVFGIPLILLLVVVVLLSIPFLPVIWLIRKGAVSK